MRLRRCGRGWAWIVASLLVLAMGSACSPAADPRRYNGYVEAEYVRVASPMAGRLTSLSVARGDEVKPQQPLFTLEQESEIAAVQGAQASLRRADAQAADLAKGKRPDELAALAAALEAARAAARQSASEYDRQVQLARDGFISGANLDTLKAKRDADAAQVREAQAQWRVGKLAARPDARAAAAAEAAAAKADLQRSQWQLEQKTVAAQAAARVDDTLYRVGEWVPAGSPVVSLVEPGGIKVRFFVPEDVVGSLRPGDTVSLRCDGCAASVAAQIRFISSTAEFTPPVIYSREQRSKLVFLVEARPAAADAFKLRPGQPVEVTLERKAS